MSLRVLIADDEMLARTRLRQLVTDCQPTLPVEVVGEAGDAYEVRQWLRNHPGGCDLILLDVQMPGDDGLLLAQSLRDAGAGGATVPLVAFVTAHPEHALRAFEIDAIDYLTKPVRRERLLDALRRASQRLSQAPAASTTAASASAPVAAAQDASLVVTERGRVLRVPIQDVLYLKAELKYVTLRTAGASHLLDEPLSELEARFGDQFLRVHRNALVSRRAMRRLERRLLTIEGEDEAGEGWVVAVEGLPNEWLAVSRRQLPAVREALQRATV